MTASRKATQLAAACRQRGAEVLVVPTVSGDVEAPDDEILTDTRAILDAAPEWVVASTGVGMRLWLEVADRGHLGQPLRELLATTPCVARGAKAVGGLARAGVTPVWTSPEETDADVAAWLGPRLRGGETVAVQVHGGHSVAYDHLAAGVDVVTVMPYRSGMPADGEAVRSLVGTLVAGAVDVITFTSPGAARNLVAVAETMGGTVSSDLRRALTQDVAVASIGPVTTEALEAVGAAVAITPPSRHRTGDLLRAIEAWAVARDGA